MPQILFPDSLILLRFIPSFALVVPDNLGEDCPVFENLFEFCQIYAGGTIGKSYNNSVFSIWLVLLWLHLLIEIFLQMLHAD